MTIRLSEILEVIAEMILIVVHNVFCLMSTGNPVHRLFCNLCQMRDINSLSRGGNTPNPNRRNSVPSKVITFPDKGRAIKGLVVCNNKDLEPLNLQNGLALGCYQPSPEV